MDEMMEVVRCKYCNKFEYYGEMRWKNGKCMCRNCYEIDYVETHNKLYEWTDLDGPRPTEQEIKEAGFDV